MNKKFRNVKIDVEIGPDWLESSENSRFWQNIHDLQGLE